MKFKMLLLLLISAIAISGCGTDKASGSTTLLNQDQQEVTFPQEKPTLFFFITTYT
ncbi:hypothetical protein [Planomicrobium sp. CPCC 101079]|uniref:hypothetical protein n=1 Tax=Planomicrobium sp. CPCC 101079 TaxID=2599618 RepID=UPI001646E719|nr:hypothetical protein [Planomicrobium sp. CPCC 101079]